MHRSGLTELEVVMAVVRRGSFRGAAQELGMSATAVSNAIAGLESRLETRLFNRTTRSVALTDAGQRYVARIGPALQEIRLAGEDPQRHRGTRRNAAPQRAEPYRHPVSGPAADRFHDPLPENARGNGERSEDDRHRSGRL